MSFFLNDRNCVKWILNLKQVIQNSIGEAIDHPSHTYKWYIFLAYYNIFL